MKNSDSSDLLKRLGVAIDPETFQHALTHRSYSFEHPEYPNNERLEFLGDSVLSLAIAEEVYRRYPELPEGELVKKHHIVVSTKSLASIARSLDLGKHLLLGVGETRTGGADKDSLLADTMEAIFGACYLSLGREEARNLVLKFVAPLLDDEKVMEEGRDWKTELQELAAAEKMGDVRYTVTGEGPDHARIYTAIVHVGDKPLGEATATAKKEAERLAAAVAVKHMTL